MGLIWLSYIHIVILILSRGHDDIVMASSVMATCDGNAWFTCVDTILYNMMHCSCMIDTLLVSGDQWMAVHVNIAPPLILPIHVSEVSAIVCWM